jgi:hypothetical protein
VVVVEEGGGGRIGPGGIFKQLTILATILPTVNLATPPKDHYLPTI